MFVVVRFDELVERHVVIGETGKRGVGVQDLERVGVVDEQADRQVGVEFLEELESVGEGLRRPSLDRSRGSCYSNVCAGIERVTEHDAFGVILNSRISGSWRLARVLRTVRARRTVAPSRMYWRSTTLSERCETPNSERRVT